MKNKKDLKRPNKTTISLKRRWAILFNRIIFFTKLLIVIFIGLFIFTDVFDAYTKKARQEFNNFTALYSFYLKNVIIEGRENSSYKDIIQTLKADKGEPIFAVDLQGTKARLEDITWVKNAMVERRLPSTIYIAIIERQPVAIWQFKQKLYLIDAEGNRITKHNGEGFPDLIHIVGQDANIYASSLLSDINTYPNLASKIKSAVRYGNRRWNLHLEQNIIVKMPENGFSKAYEYLHLLNKDKKLFDQNYKMLDLRDPNKYYLEKE